MVKLYSTLSCLVQRLHSSVERRPLGRRCRLDAEQRVVVDTVQQVESKMRNGIFAKVPASQNPTGHVGAVVTVAAGAEILAEVLAVPIALDKTYNEQHCIKFYMTTV